MRALAALLDIPAVEYECGEERNEEEIQKSSERIDAIKTYAENLSSTFARAAWWNVPVNELNACLVTHEARALTKDESDELIYKTNVFGDGKIRLVTSIDPCIHYSSDTINGFILSRNGSKATATQVLDAFYSRADASVNFDIAMLGKERVALVRTDTLDGMMPPMPYVTLRAFSIDPRGRAIPKKIFFSKNVPSNEFEYPTYVFDDDRLYRQFKEPIIVKNGKFASSFTVMTLHGRRYLSRRYVWDGKSFH